MNVVESVKTSRFSANLSLSIPSFGLRRKRSRKQRKCVVARALRSSRYVRIPTYDFMTSIHRAPAERQKCTAKSVAVRRPVPACPT